MILLKSVLNSIPIFFLSFLKMPNNGVRRRMVRIERRFLRGGFKGVRRIPCVRRSNFCKLKSEGW